ncbi:hypothetical protein GCM10011613_14770 [Cellvibrio zantedeschiae]|uniref:Uncharacterized protein n=1 Tax=Cellvibrio zantedeschiae TaxID=1237077 RepID=A0ABQ3AYG9_9GAMM|nr:hypothetical protein [Cellvibrio zantedeschiae]GGY71198.1 hypothetical protein GCM10011613_14770 [Cellvibrio zantedeschiae]
MADDETPFDEDALLLDEDETDFGDDTELDTIGVVVELEGALEPGVVIGGVEIVDVADDLGVVVVVDVLTDEEEFEAGSGFGDASEGAIELEKSLFTFPALVEPLALAPPPQAAVSNGAIKTITAVVAFKRRCQFKLVFNWWRLIKPNSIKISPSSVLALIFLVPNLCDCKAC